MKSMHPARPRASLVAHATLLSAAVWSCSGNDATNIQEEDQETLPSEPSGSAGTGAGGSAGSGSGNDGGTGGSESTSEGGSAGLDLDPSGGAGGEATPGEAASYWEDGITSSESGVAEARFLGVSMDSENNVYAVGFSGAALGENRTMLIRKYDSSGELDAAFGGATGAGSVLVDWSPYAGTADDASTADTDESDPSVEEANDVALQSDGRIIVAGRTEDPTVTAPDASTPADIVVFRLEADGTLDASFGDGGRLILNPGGGPADLVYGIEVDESDRIYVFGHGLSSDPARTDRDRYAWRLTPDGALDTTFATGGEYSFDIPQGTSTLALDDNARRGVVIPQALGGGVVLGGYTNVAGRNQVVLAQLDDAGVPKSSFSGDGIVRLAPFPTGMAEAYGVTLQSDGSAVTTGYGNIDLERGGGAALLDMVSFRVRPDGSYDTSWGTGGAAVYDSTGGEDRGRALHSLPDDRVMIAGTTTVTAGDKDAMLLLLDRQGAPARDFDAATHKAYDFGGTNEEFRAVDVSPSGDFVAAAGFSSGREGVDAPILVVVPVTAAAE